MATAPDSAAYGKRQRNFFLGFVIAAWTGVLLGFFPASWGRIHGKADYVAPFILHIHAVSFVVWMLLLTVQVALIRRASVAVHRRNGAIGVALVPVMVVSGFLAEAYSQRHYLANPPDSQAFFIVPIFYVVAFGVLATLAFLNRRDPASHKRLIYLATTIIAGAAWTRAIGTSIAAATGDGFLGMIANTFTSTNLFLLAIAVFDWRTRGELHPVLRLGIPAIVASEFAVSWIYHAPGWLPVAYAIASSFPGPPIPPFTG